MYSWRPWLGNTGWLSERWLEDVGWLRPTRWLQGTPGGSGSAAIFTDTGWLKITLRLIVTVCPKDTGWLMINKRLGSRETGELGQRGEQLEQQQSDK